jgi:hypothetical protein
METNNLELWQKVEKTNPKYTNKANDDAYQSNEEIDYLPF